LSVEGWSASRGRMGYQDSDAKRIATVSNCLNNHKNKNSNESKVWWLNLPLSYFVRYFHDMTQRASPKVSNTSFLLVLG